MKTFLILEDGNLFAALKARTAEGALRKAAREFPRRAVDYNLRDGESCNIEWFAREAYGTESARATVEAPGKGPPRF